MSGLQINISAKEIEYYSVCRIFKNDISKKFDRFLENSHPNSSNSDNSINSDSDSDFIYGLFLVILVSLTCTLGIFILPLFKNFQKLYDYAILFLMSLAVSALSGAALLVLIPEGLGFMECDSEVIVDKNIWICYGIIFFYVLEQGISYFGRINQENFGFKQVEEQKSDASAEPVHENQTLDSETSLIIQNRSLLKNLKSMKIVGWLCLIGDAFHNLLDGIGMGATFKNSIQSGIPITIAILAEEFPHELGDYAILVKAGLTPKQAVVCNLFSASTCVAGYFIGWYMTSILEDDALVIFSIMGGVFLYLSLVSMLGEVKEQLDRLLRKNWYMNSVTSSSPKERKSRFMLEIGMLMAISCFGLLLGYQIVYQCQLIDWQNIFESQ